MSYADKLSYPQKMNIAPFRARALAGGAKSKRVNPKDSILHDLRQPFV
jgi:hypothetical protein